MRRSVLPAILLVLLVYIGTLAVLPREGFWIVDNANRFLQLRGFVDSGYTSFAIPWRGQAYDPDFSSNPIPPPFSRVNDGQLFSAYSPVFPLVSSLPYRAFGFWGLYLIPLAGAALTLVAVARLGGALGLSPGTRSAAVVLAGLCTPIWFYGVVFWEHTAAVCCCVWAVHFFTGYLRAPDDRPLLAGSALAALGVYFRDELYLFCAVLLVVLVALVRGRRLRTLWLGLACTATTLAPLWLFQWKALGQPFGFHLANHVSAGVAQHLSARPVVLYNLFVASHQSPFGSLVIAAPFLIAFVLNPRWSRSGFRVAVPLLGTIALAGSYFSFKGYGTSGDPINWLIAANSLFAAAPVLILAFVRVREAEKPAASPALVRWLWVLSLGYAVLYGIVAPQVTSWGIHWGNRFLLVLYPILALLAAVSLGQWFSWLEPRFRWAALPVVTLVLVTLGAQVYSVQLLRWKTEFSVRLTREIRNRDEAIVISDVWWVPQELFSSFYDKSLFYTETPRHMNGIVTRARAAGQREFLFVTLANERPDPRAALEIRDHDLGFFSVTCFHGDIP